MDFRFLGKFPFTNFLSPAFLSCRHLFKLLTAFSYSLAIFLFLSDFYRQVGPFSTLLVLQVFCFLNLPFINVLSFVPFIEL